jgi:hypothetical protein
MKKTSSSSSGQCVAQLSQDEEVKLVALHSVQVDLHNLFVAIELVSTAEKLLKVSNPF